METPVNLETIRERLRSFEDTLNSDGYTLNVESVKDGCLNLAILATENACEDCLVSKDIMQMMFLNKLGGTGIQDIEFRYPNEHKSKNA